jgi:RNA polymerase sigma-70 factor (ECF subfamily)
MAPNVATSPDGDENPRSLDELFQWLYKELRPIAKHYMAGERADATLQTTALIHEAYLRLKASDVKVQSRLHFLRLVARTMRRVLIDEARRKKREKYGGNWIRVSLSDGAGVIFPRIDMIDFDRALDKLARLHERQATVIELRIFLCFSVEEVAAELGVSPRTVKGDTRVALAWLRRELE